jgi:glycosyltransferase involved in cell wall biosynthesis
MKILQVISYFSPKFGGDVNVCTNLSKELATGNHDVTIITTDFGFDPQYADTIRAEGVTVIPFPCIANLGLFLYSPSMKIWLENHLMVFDIIHLHNYRSYQNVVVRKYAIKFGIHYIVQAHGSVLPIFQKQYSKKLYDIVWGYQLLQNASRCIAVSKVERDQYLKMGIPENKIEIIPNGIDVSEYETLPEHGKFRKKYGIAADEKIILYLGRLHKRKGIDLLIESFIEIRKNIKNVKLVIIGPDDGFKKFLINLVDRSQIRKDVVFLDFINDNEKISAMFDADVFVTPRFSGFPITFLEACACGIPIVTTNNGDVLEWIDNKVGFVVDYDKVSLANAIIKILNDQKLSEKFCLIGKSFVNNKFNLETVVTNVKACYQQIIENKNK